MDFQEYKNNLISFATSTDLVSNLSEHVDNTIYVDDYLHEYVKVLSDNSSFVPVETLISIIDSGTSGLHKIQNLDSDLSQKELLGLEAIIRIEGRPAILINDNKFLQPPPPWKFLDQHRNNIGVPTLM
jgi:hypothetical protein